MKPFRQKLEKKFKEELIEPIERELGIKFADYTGLVQGQCTLAVVQNGWQGKDNQFPAWLILIDSRDKTNDLKTRLSDLRKKWTDAGKKMKSEKIRDVEFTTLVTAGADLGKALEKSLPDSKPDKPDKSDKPDKPDKPDKSTAEDNDKKPGKPTEITVGQSESLLII